MPKIYYTLMITEEAPLKLALRSVICGFMTLFSLSELSFAQSISEKSLGQAHSLLLPNDQHATLDVVNNSEAIKIRIPLIVTPFKLIASKGLIGEKGFVSVPEMSKRHNLIARINKPNQFFLGDYRVETTPLKLLKSSLLYSVKIDLYRLYGAYGQLEEFLGTFTAHGKMVAQDPTFYTLVGTSKFQFRDSAGKILVELAAGRPLDIPTQSPALSKLEK